MASQTCLPVGFRFTPTDEQLLWYLHRKIHGLPHYQGAIFDCDLYGPNEPWQIWNHFCGLDGQDLYFFTTLKTSTTKCGRLSAHVNRKVGSGTWSGENSPEPIFSKKVNTQEVIGFRKRFRYENAQLSEHNGEWIMHEYMLQDDLINVGAPYYVLCRIRKNDRPKKKEENEIEPRNKKVRISKRG